MRNATVVSRPFVWRTPQGNTLIEKGARDLTPEQYAHAEKHGFLQPIQVEQPEPLAAKKQKTKPEEVTGND